MRTRPGSTTATRTRTRRRHSTTTACPARRSAAMRWPPSQPRGRLFLWATGRAARRLAAMEAWGFHFRGSPTLVKTRAVGGISPARASGHVRQAHHPPRVVCLDLPPGATPAAPQRGPGTVVLAPAAAIEKPTSAPAVRGAARRPPRIELFARERVPAGMLGQRPRSWRRRRSRRQLRRTRGRPRGSRSGTEWRPAPSGGCRGGGANIDSTGRVGREFGIFRGVSPWRLLSCPSRCSTTPPDAMGSSGKPGPQRY